MPVRYVIDKERKLVITMASGRVTFAEMKAHQDQLERDPDFKPEFDQFVDGAAVTALDISADEVRVLVRHKVFAQTSRRAWVAPSPPVYGMSRLMGTYQEMLNARSTISVFYDFPSALKFLGLKALPDAIKAEAKNPNTAKAEKNDEKIT